MKNRLQCGCTGLPLPLNTVQLPTCWLLEFQFDCVHDVCNAPVEFLLDDYVRFPRDKDLKDVVAGYEEHWGLNFPNCGGAIDDTHIPIRGS